MALSTTRPSGIFLPSSTMVLRSEPSGFADKTRPPATSRKKRRPIAVLPPDANLDLVACSSVMVFPFKIVRLRPSYPATPSTCRWEVASLGRRRVLLRFWYGAARAEAVDFGGAEPELLENLLVVFSKRRRALRSHFRYAVHLN